MRLAIIDDGILPHVTKKFHNIKVFHLAVNAKGVFKDYSIFLVHKITHGTLCFVEFAQKIDKVNVEIYSINIIKKKENRGDIENLIIALKWCIENNVKLINMSVGTANYWDFYKLRPLIEKLDQQKKIVVAAHSNKYVFSYPAISEFAIGVRFDNTGTLLEGEYYVVSEKVPNYEVICAKAVVNELKKYVDLGDECNSFAAPLLLATIVKLLLDNNFDRNTVIKLLQQSSKLSYNLWQMRRNFIKTKALKIPIVLGDFKDESNLYYIKEITSLFIKNNYCVFTVLCEDTNESIPYINLKMLLNNCDNNIEYALLFLQNYSNADIILVQSDERVINYHPFDVVITDQMSEWLLDENVIVTHDKSIQYIFDKLIKELS